MITKKQFVFLVRYWFPPICFVLVVFSFSTIPDLRSAFPPPIDFILRKIAHMTEFFVLTILFARIQLHGKKKEFHASILFGAGILALAAAFLDEFVIQALTPGRFGTIKDVGIDTVGIVAALSFLFLLGRRKGSGVSHRT